MPARIRIRAQAFDELLNLIDFAAIGGFPMPPLRAVYGAQVPVFIGPFIPDGNAMIAQIFDVRFATEKPQKLVNDGAQVQLFGGEKRETIGEVEAHLVAEDAQGASTGSVVFPGALLEKGFQKIQVGAHGPIASGNGLRVNLREGIPEHPYFAAPLPFSSRSKL